MEAQLEAAGRLDYRGFIEQRLLKERSILIYGQITQEVAQDVTEKLLVLNADSDAEIKIYINSQGGHVESGDTIFDMIRFCKAPVKIIGTGYVASAGALIFVAPPVEWRVCLPNTRFLIHQPMGGTMGSAVDMAIEAKEIVKMRKRLNQTFAAQTGQPFKKVEKDSDRNYWMSAAEAKEYGLVGKIIENADKL